MDSLILAATSAAYPCHILWRLPISYSICVPVSIALTCTRPCETDPAYFVKKLYFSESRQNLALLLSNIEPIIFILFSFLFFFFCTLVRSKNNFDSHTHGLLLILHTKAYNINSKTSCEIYVQDKAYLPLDWPKKARTKKMYCFPTARISDLTHCNWKEYIQLTFPQNVNVTSFLKYKINLVCLGILASTHPRGQCIFISNVVHSPLVEVFC